MKKKTTAIIVMMLCLTAQYAEAFKITAKKASVPESDDNTTLWFILAFGGVILLIFLYNNWSKIKSFFSFISGSFRVDKSTDLSEEQQRKILLSGVFSAQKGAFMNVVKTGIDRGDRQGIFVKGWGITDKGSALDKLEYLKLKGTRRYFRQVVESLKLKNKQDIKQYISSSFEEEEDMCNCWEQVQLAFESIGPLLKEGMIKDEADFARIGADAWDAGRLVFMARLCREHDYIDDETMWKYIDSADEIAHHSLTSWEDFGKSYIIGRCLWCGTANYFEVMAGHAKRMYSKAESPWKSFSF